MIDATTALVARLRELDAKAANGALPGTPWKWCAILDDPNEPPGIYTESYSVIRDDAREADHDDLRLIAEMRNALPGLLDSLEKATTALQAIDAIRNDIIARQGIGWSRHVYPLVAALGDAGYEGEGYEKGRPRIEADDATIARLTARVAELEACSECAGKGCHACRSTGHVRSQVEALRLERDRLTARVVELERELDDDVSPADQETLEAMVKRTMARYETRIEEQKRLSSLEARVAELEADMKRETSRAITAEVERDAALYRMSELEDLCERAAIWRVRAPLGKP